MPVKSTFATDIGSRQDKRCITESLLHRERKLFEVVNDHFTWRCSASEILVLHGVQSLRIFCTLKVGNAQPRKRRRVAVRFLDESKIVDIKAHLKTERANYITNHPALAILGVQLVCPDSVIDSICSNVKFVSVASDMDRFCLRRELKPIFYNVIMAAL